MVSDFELEYESNDEGNVEAIAVDDEVFTEDEDDEILEIIEDEVANIGAEELDIYTEGSEVSDEEEVIVLIDENENENEDENQNKIWNETSTQEETFNGRLQTDILKTIPVYLDFCEFIPDSNDISTFGLNHCTIDFDFMKLYPPQCEEDELYLEISTLFRDFDECKELNMRQVFDKIRDIVGFDCEINFEIEELFNFRLSSDNKMIEDVKISEILKIWNENNHDFEFLTIKVWCSNNIQRQIDIMKGRI